MGLGIFDELFGNIKIKMTSERLEASLREKGMRFREIVEIPGGFRIVCGYMADPTPYYNKLYQLACEMNISVAGTEYDDSGDSTFFIVYHR